MPHRVFARTIPTKSLAQTNQFNQFIPMTTEVGAFEAKTHLSRLLDQVEQGDTIIITRHGKRIAEINPVKTRKKAVRGCAKGPPGSFYMAPDFDAPLEEFKDYM